MFDGGINLFDAFTRLPLQNEYVAQLLRPVASSLLPGGDMLTIRIGGRTASSHQFGVTLERIALESRRSGIMLSRLLSLQTHRSMSLAIRHHAITRSDSGAQVARLDGPASCLRASPSLPLKTTLRRSSPHAPAPSSFTHSQFTDRRALRFGIRAIPPTSFALRRMHRSSLRQRSRGCHSA